MGFDELGAPIRVGGLTLKNRMVFPPISTNLAAIDGEVTEAFSHHYARRAEGGATRITWSTSASTSRPRWRASPSRAATTWRRYPG